MTMGHALALRGHSGAARALCWLGPMCGGRRRPSGSAYHGDILRASE